MMSAGLLFMWCKRDKSACNKSYYVKSLYKADIV